MGIIKGTYDVLMLSFLLPQEQVLQLVSSSLKSDENLLLPVPSHVIDLLKPAAEAPTAENGKLHPVLIQMGYQISTGPGPTWIPKFSFSECKLEVPFLRHPSGKSSLTYNLKQHMIFSNPVIKMGSQATGLRSSSATFTPPTSPNHANEGSQEIQYTASGFVDATATKAGGASVESWAVYRDMLESWWYGGGTGEVTQKFLFDWDNAAVKPEAYEVNVKLDLAAFAEKGPGMTSVSARGLGWRTRVSVVSTASTAGKEER